MADYHTGGFYDFLGQVFLAAGKGAYERIEKGEAGEKTKGVLDKGVSAITDTAKKVVENAPGVKDAVVDTVKKEAVKKATNSIALVVLIGLIILSRRR